MKKFWYYFYNVLVFPSIYFVFRIASLFNDKIKRGLRARKFIYKKISEEVIKNDSEKKIIWFHSASMGEFEQAKPIIEELKIQSDIKVLVTFFSPSGYDNSLKYPHADIITYLPLDKVSHIRDFLDIINPSILVIMRYDIWPNLIWELHRREIPVFLVDATMKSNNARSWPFAKSFFKTVYKCLTRVLTVSDTDLQNFLNFDIPDSRLEAVGDTRFDRVYQRSITAREKKLFREDFFKGKNVFVCGSSWELDEEVLFPAFIKAGKYDPNSIMILAPHEPTISRLEKIEAELTGKISCIRFSYLNNYKDEKVILIDSIGILSTLYYYSQVAFVGGSFKQRIHNVLEAAVYGIPVLFGPKYHNSQESQTLAESGGAIVISNKKETFKQLRLLFRNEEIRIKKGKICSDLVMKNIGATEKIVKEISNYVE